MRKVRVSHREPALSSVAIVRLIFSLLVLLLIAICVQQYHEFVRETEFHHATDSDLLDNRIAVLGMGIEAYTLQGLSGIRVLENMVLLERGISAEDKNSYNLRLQDYVKDSGLYYFVRYLPITDSVPLYAGETADTPSEGEPGSPFTDLAQISAQEGPGQITASDFVGYTTPTGDTIPLIYVYVPMVEGSTTIGAYEIGFNLTPLFTDVQQAERTSETIVLLDNKGRYLVAPDGSERRSLEIIRKLLPIRYFLPSLPGILHMPARYSLSVM